MKENRGKKRKPSNIIIPAILIGIIVFSAYKLISIQLSYKEANDEYDMLTTYAVEEPVIEKQSEHEENANDNAIVTGNQTDDVMDGSMVIGGVTEFPPMRINYEALTEINHDFVAWLRIPALDISYPIVQGNDNDWYLNRTFEKKYNSAGCIFVDYENAGDFTDMNTYVYGHNMKNASMFGGLKRFRQEEGLCASDPYFYIYTPDSVNKYEIFAYYITDTSSDRYMLLTNEEEYHSYVQAAFRYTEYASETEIDFSECPDIVTLSTCSGAAGGTKRMLVHGVLVGQYENLE